MHSVEIILDALGHAKVLGAPTEMILAMTNAISGNLEIIVNVLGPDRGIGGTRRDNPGPKQ